MPTPASNVPPPQPPPLYAMAMPPVQVVVPDGHVQVQPRVSVTPPVVEIEYAFAYGAAHFAAPETTTQLRAFVMGERATSPPSQGSRATAGSTSHAATLVL